MRNSDFKTKAVLTIDSIRSTTVDIVSGLVGSPKRIDAKWLYDERGSQLFDRITRLPEYYPTDTERDILCAQAGHIASIVACDTLIELGSGSSDKTRLLLDSLINTPDFDMFVPIDVSADFLATSAADLRAEYPGIRIEPQVADFTRALNFPAGDRRLVIFLGGTIGNLYPQERRKFLSDLCRALRPGDYLLLGADLVKDPQRIIEAYWDTQGMTAAFITNVIRVISREIGVRVDPADFEYVPMWDARNERMDLRLRSRREINVSIPVLGTAITFAPGEELHVEISSKFRLPNLRTEITESGFEVDRIFTDAAEDFSLTLARVVSTGITDSNATVRVEGDLDGA